jgi:hypothetical protein
MDVQLSCSWTTCGSSACQETGPIASLLGASRATRRDYEQLIKAVTVASRDSSFEAAHDLLADPRVHLNTSRGSLQVIVCDGQSIIANLPLRSNVATRLAEALRDANHSLAASETSGN